MRSSLRLIAHGLASVAAFTHLPSHAQSLRAMSEAEMKAANGRQLLASELSEKLVGSSCYVLALKRFGPFSQGGVATIFHRDNRNRVSGVSRNQKYESIWWFEGNDVCGEQRTTSSNACYRFFELGGAVYMCDRASADCFATVRFVPGNPENL